MLIIRNELPFSNVNVSKNQQFKKVNREMYLVGT